MKYICFAFACLFCVTCQQKPEDSDHYSILTIAETQGEETLSVYRKGESTPILTQHVQQSVRPYIHPIQAPDGKGQLTEFQPSHHKHQTGLYWGLKMVNGRDFFMGWQEEHYRKVSDKIVLNEGRKVSWQTVYDLLDEEGNVVLTESQNWTMQEQNGKYILDFLCHGEAKTDITFGQFYVGGLFLRMPWKEGIKGEVINAAGQRNQEAEQQRSIWLDIGLQVEGRDDLAHIALFDFPDNDGFPIPWRVDGELGVGPSQQILGDYEQKKGEVKTVRYRLIAYTGEFNHDHLMASWKEFVTEF